MAEANPVGTGIEELNICEEDQQENLHFVEDVLDGVFYFLDSSDLIVCRLVNKLWKLCATRYLKSKVRMIKHGRDVSNTSLIKFLSDTENRDRDCPLPYGKYHIDISQKIDPAKPHLIKKFFEMITQDKCNKLKISFNYGPDSPATAMDEAMSRNENMNFVYLENLEFLLLFREGFLSEHVNMPEILEKSEGIRKLNIGFTTYITATMQHAIVSNILTTVTNPVNNYRCLSTLGFDFSYLNSEHLDILTAWAHPLQNLALGCFDLKPDPKVGFPSAALASFLASKSYCLQTLRLKLNKKFPWEDLVEENVDDLHEDNFRINMKWSNPSRMNFPRMPNLLSLELMASNIIDVSWAWRLDKNSFPEQFPKLKRFCMNRFCYSTADSPGFMPKLNKPLATVEEVCLPDAKDLCNPTLMYQMLSLFPKLKVLEIKYNKLSLEIIFSSVPNLEKLLIHIGDELVHLDGLLTGVPSLTHMSDVSPTEALTFNIELAKTRPGLSNLTNLKELSLTTEDYYVRMTDVTVYHVFLKMKHFCRLTVNAYPFEDNTSWLISESCMKRLKEMVHVTLNVFQSSRREKFFV